MSLYIGLMSGTSMDGIDAALVDTTSNTLLYGITKQYSAPLKKRIDAVIRGEDLNLASLAQLNTLIGREFAQATLELLERAEVAAKDVVAIGSHGQTLEHDAFASIPYTVQSGCGHTIASLTGITVVADFRTRDLVHGGQGAPFAPLYHQELFGASKEPIAVVNIGGIANITLLSPKNTIKGWDIGPGNCLMDAWISYHKQQSFDADGWWASEGEQIPLLLNQLLRDPFLSQNPPKSIGKEYFSLAWLDEYLKKEYAPVDVQQTLLALTAHTIATTILHAPDLIRQVYICGGGAHNRSLMDKLSELLPGISVQSTAQVGVSPDFMEAMMFAWLAAQTLNNKPVDLSAITGSDKPIVLGAVYPAVG